VFYAAGASGKRFIVFDEQEGKSYDRIALLAAAPQGSRFVYSAGATGHWQLVLDGKVGMSYADIASIVFSPDGKHVAYGAQTGDHQWLVVADGSEGKTYMALLGIASDTPARYHYLAVDGNRLCLVEDSW
jgi:hypothetical protein